MEMVDQNFKRTRTQPLPVPQTTRIHDCRVLTSLPAGKMVPLLAAGILREDAVRRAQIRYSFEMMESAEILMNAVNVAVKAYFVPWLALDRFEGSMDQLNRSYEGQPQVDGGSVIPFIETHTKGADLAEEIYTYLGLHATPTDAVSTMIRESYNLIWNFRAANRSDDITPVALTNTALQPAFWQHHQFRSVVSDFDQAVIDGEVALNVVNANMPVKGIAFGMGAGTPTYGLTGPGDRIYESGEVGFVAPANTDGNRWSNQDVALRQDATNLNNPNVFAELAADGITVSLSNIEMAKKTAAFATLKQQYAGLSDDWIVDMLMDGLSVPDQALKQPILLADKSTFFGMQKRYATDAANLAESAVNGATFVDLTLRLPKMSTGGTVMVVAEVTPEQLFERQKDPYFHLGSVDDLPQYLRDTLDPEKVEVVENDTIDVDHATPAGTFGYAPLNWRWNTQIPHVGGKFYRPDAAAAFDEDRERIWTVETQNPTLSADFYLATNIHQNVFADTVGDPFEVVGIGAMQIVGNTVFGQELREAGDLYDEVAAEQPTTRITKA